MKKLISIFAATALICGTLTAVPVQVGASGTMQVIVPFAKVDFENPDEYGTYINPNRFDKDGAIADCGDHDPMKIVSDETHSGNGAVYFGGTNSATIWKGISLPAGTIQEGELISGSYYVKVLRTNSPGWEVPRIRLKMSVDGEEFVLCESRKDSLWDYKGGWYELQMDSTEIPFVEITDENNNVNLTFEMAGVTPNCEYVIDDISFGTQQEVETEEQFVSYEMYENLKFNKVYTDGLWSGGAEGDKAFTIHVNDSDFVPYEGSGVAAVNGGKGGYSLWDGSQTAAKAEDGDLVCGYFMLCLNQKRYDMDESIGNNRPWFKLPVMTFKLNDGNGEEVAYFHPDDFDYSTWNQGEWIRVPIRSTGVAINKNDRIYYNIVNTNGSGVQFLIDDINIGTMREAPVVPTPEPTSTPSAEPTTPPEAYVPAEYDGVPQFAAYGIGNGDFEDETEAVEYQDKWAQNWGMWTSNGTDGNGNAYTYVKNSPIAYSGSDIVKVNRGGTMWSITNNADFISAHAGDMVGGYYMLYVPEGANLRDNYPSVKIETVIDGTNYYVAQSPDNVSKFPVVEGAWNRIPIVPTGKTVDTKASTVTMLIVSANILSGDVSNAPYDVPFYIDNISFGKVDEGLFVSDKSSAAVTADGVEAKVVVQNTQNADATSVMVAAGAYDADGRLLGAAVSDRSEIAAAGVTGFAATTFDCAVSIESVPDNITVKAFVFDGTDQATPVTISDIVYKDANEFFYDDENIAYIGRWVDMADSKKSGWGGAYFKTVFSGSSVKLDAASSANVFVSVDGEPDVLYSIPGNGIIDVTPDGLADGEHTLRVAAKYTTDSIRLKGIILNDGESLSAPQVSDTVIEFIGDSNTAGYLLPQNQIQNYSWLVGELLGEHVHIAYTGMALSTGIFDKNINRSVGMNDMFFKPDPYDSADSQNWDFDTYQADIVCINLGGNDFNATAVPGGAEEFVKQLPEFVTKVRAVYPDAAIVLINPTTSDQGSANQTALLNYMSGDKLDDNIYYFDANEIVPHTDPSVTLSDNTHISVEGNQILAAALLEFIGSNINF